MIEFYEACNYIDPPKGLAPHVCALFERDGVFYYGATFPERELSQALDLPRGAPQYLVRIRMKHRPAPKMAFSKGSFGGWL